METWFWTAMSFPSPRMIMIDVSSSSSLHLRIPLATSRIAIKFVKSHTCCSDDADALRLCIHTSIPVDRNFKESTRHLKLDSKKKNVTYGKFVSSLPGIPSWASPPCSCQGRVRTPKVSTLHPLLWRLHAGSNNIARPLSFPSKCSAIIQLT